MRIKVINPNTSASMTALIGRVVTSVAGPDCLVETVNPAMGPESIESHYDEALSVPGILAEIMAERFDGYVIACFGDPGLDAARELADGPVVGIAEAAMRTAAYLGRGFSVVTTLERTCGRAWDLAERYGVSRFCLGVSACDIPVLEVDTALDEVAFACQKAVATDRSDAVVLGCAGMTAHCAQISARVGVPVIDGVQAAVLQVESLIRMGLRTGALSEFASPSPKPYTGILAQFGTARL